MAFAEVLSVKTDICRNNCLFLKRDLETDFQAQSLILVSSLAFVERAMYSISADKSATMDCRMLSQLTGVPQIVAIKPVVDCRVFKACPFGF